MDPVTIANEALIALDGLLNIINAIRGQGGMTDDAIVAAADAQTLDNANQIKVLLASLPPITPPAAAPAG
jgi:hypothetical protein